MPIRFASGVLLVALLVCIPAGALGAGPAPNPNPTPAQIRSAIKQAGRSPDLWATVNACNTRAHPDALGIRGQMPALGFRSQLSMAIAVDFWDSSQKRFRGTGVQKRITLGHFRFQAHQTGWVFRFGAHAGLLRSTTTFQWTRLNKVIGHLTRTTTGGHKHVDQSDPPGHSAATCQIP